MSHFCQNYSPAYPILEKRSAIQIFSGGMVKFQWGGIGMPVAIQKVSTK